MQYVAHLFPLVHEKMGREFGTFGYVDQVGFRTFFKVRRQQPIPHEFLFGQIGEQNRRSPT